MQRIRQLILESGLVQYESDEKMQNAEQFARLVIEECADWINENVGMIDEEARECLLRHFGIV